MKRLNVDEFKKIIGDQSNELENLTGGVLGECHEGVYTTKVIDGKEVEIIIYN